MPDASITMIDENEFISYGGCGIPYFVSGEVQNVDALRQTNADEIRDPGFSSPPKNIDVPINTRALSIDRSKSVSLSKISKPAEEKNRPDDKLVIATGASHAHAGSSRRRQRRRAFPPPAWKRRIAIRHACETGKVNGGNCGRRLYRPGSGRCPGRYVGA